MSYNGGMTTTDSVAITEWEDRLGKAINRHGLAVTPRDIIAVLADAAEPSAPVTATERDFLTEHAGITGSDLTAQALSEVDVEIASNRAVAARDVQRDSLTTQDVAQMLGTAPANVRRLVGDGALYSVKASPGGHHWFPRWQFPHSRALPGLSAVINALPDNYHPVEVEAFMTETSEVLRGMSPVEWLAGGGEPSEAVALADERAWE